jgi:xanthine dehydrogenase YagR molybdenum-binding subunit
MTTGHTAAVGASIARIEGREKVTGQAQYADDHRAHRLAYGWIVQSRIARGRVIAIDAEAALAVPGVLKVLYHGNAPRLLGETDNRELAVFQSPQVAYRGQAIACVIAETLETAREAAGEVRVEYDAEPHDFLLASDHPGLWAPEQVNPFYPGQTERGDPDLALVEAEVVVDQRYSTPAQHNNPMEAHATLAIWQDEALTLYDSSQGAPIARGVLARLFALAPAQVRVISEHVGGGLVKSVDVV